MGKFVVTRRKKQPNDAFAAGTLVLADQLRRDVAGQWTDNRLEQSAHYRGVIYVAIRAIMDAIYSTTIQLNRKHRKFHATSLRRLEKALPTPAANTEDEQFRPFDDPGHSLVKLMDRPNRTETFNELLAQLVLQYHLTGSGLMWANPNDYDVPAELYVIPTALAYAQPATPDFPEGWWRVTSYYPSGGYGILPSPLMGGGAPVDARDIFVFKNPHPLWRWDAMSPLTAVSTQLDVLEAIDLSRWSAMESGLTPDMVIMAPGVNQKQLDVWLEKLKQTNIGKRNHRKVMAVGGDQGDAKFDVKFPSQSAKDMDFTGGWDQMVAFALAAFGVPKSVAGLATTGSYAELYAALKQFHTLTLRPLVARMGEWLTRHLAHIWGEDFAIQLDLPTIDDQQLQETQLATDLAHDGLTYNEYRAIRGRKPVPGGEVLCSVYVQQQQAKAQAAMQAQQPQPGDPNAQPPQGADPSQGAQDPQAAAQPSPAPNGASPPAPAAGPQQGGDPLAAVLGQPEPGDGQDSQNAVTQAALGALGVPEQGAAPAGPIQKYYEAVIKKAVAAARQRVPSAGTKVGVGGTPVGTKTGSPAGTRGATPSSSSSLPKQNLDDHEPGEQFASASGKLRQGTTTGSAPAASPKPNAPPPEQPQPQATAADIPPKAASQWFATLPPEEQKQVAIHVNYARAGYDKPRPQFLDESEHPVVDAMIDAAQRTGKLSPEMRQHVPGYKDIAPVKQATPEERQAATRAALGDKAPVRTIDDVIQKLVARPDLKKENFTEENLRRMDPAAVAQIGEVYGYKLPGGAPSAQRPSKMPFGQQLEAAKQYKEMPTADLAPEESPSAQAGHGDAAGLNQLPTRPKNDDSLGFKAAFSSLGPTGVTDSFLNALQTHLAKTGDVMPTERQANSQFARAWDEVKKAGLDKHPEAVQRFIAAAGDVLKGGGKWHDALNKQFAGSPPQSQAAVPVTKPTQAPVAPKEEIAATVNAGQMPPAESFAPHADAILPTVSVDPKWMETANRVHEWAGQHADRHADRVAAHFGIDRDKARSLLTHAIQSIVVHAANKTAAGGGDTVQNASGTLTHTPSGQSLSLSLHPRRLAAITLVNDLAEHLRAGHELEPKQAAEFAVASNHLTPEQAAQLNNHLDRHMSVGEQKNLARIVKHTSRVVLPRDLTPLVQQGQRHTPNAPPSGFVAVPPENPNQAGIDAFNAAAQPSSGPNAARAARGAAAGLAAGALSAGQQAIGQSTAPPSPVDQPQPAMVSTAPARPRAGYEHMAPGTAPTTSLTSGIATPQQTPGQPAQAAAEPVHNPDVNEVGEHGITKAARVGVEGIPDRIPVLPNLIGRERRVENAFREKYHQNPDGMADQFIEIAQKIGQKKGGPPEFGTDDAKMLAKHWQSPELEQDKEQRSKNRAMLNTALHQTANAIAKRAFVKHLDTLKPGDKVMVTVGGVGAGKGYALKNVDRVRELKSQSKAVWDSAGDQNATENPDIQKELEKRGLKGVYVYVHTNPYVQWNHPEKGVVSRAAKPDDGRMVDAHVFADSYALGAKNHQKFYEAHQNNPNAEFVFIDNNGKPRELPGIPPADLNLNRDDLLRHAIRKLHESDAPEHVKHGGSLGSRIWGPPPPPPPKTAGEVGRDKAVLARAAPPAAGRGDKRRQPPPARRRFPLPGQVKKADDADEAEAEDEQE